MNDSFARSSESFERGDLIQREDQEASHFYIVEEGELIVFTLRNSRIIPLQKLRTGDTLGEDAIFTNKDNYGVYAMALTQSKLLKIERAPVDRYLAEGSPWLRSLLSDIACKLDRTNQVATQEGIGNSQDFPEGLDVDTESFIHKQLKAD